MSITLVKPFSHGEYSGVNASAWEGSAGLKLSAKRGVKAWGASPTGKALIPRHSELEALFF